MLCSGSVVRTAEQSGYSQIKSRLSELVDTNSTSLAWKQNWMKISVRQHNKTPSFKRIMKDLKLLSISDSQQLTQNYNTMQYTCTSFSGNVYWKGAAHNCKQCLPQLYKRNVLWHVLLLWKLLFYYSFPSLNDE